MKEVVEKEGRIYVLIPREDQCHSEDQLWHPFRSERTGTVRPMVPGREAACNALVSLAEDKHSVQKP